MYPFINLKDPVELSSMEKTLFKKIAREIINGSFLKHFDGYFDNFHVIFRLLKKIKPDWCVYSVDPIMIKYSQSENEVLYCFGREYEILFNEITKEYCVNVIDPKMSIHISFDLFKNETKIKSFFEQHRNISLALNFTYTFKNKRWKRIQRFIYI